MKLHRERRPDGTRNMGRRLRAGFGRWSGALPSVIATALASGLFLNPALSCGPDFPVTLLDRREQVMSGLPEGVFDFEVAHLLPKPGDALKPVEPASTWDDTDKPRADAEAAGLAAGAGERIAAMAAAATVDAAAAQAGELPRDVALYGLGAWHWNHGEFDAAETQFRAVIDLPAAERSHRGVWASYMLGRSRAQSGDRAGADAAFEQTRAWVRAGASDPLGLAVASLGEQARVAREAGDLAAAVRLYAEQAAYGSNGGRNSLLFVARAAVRDPAQIDALLADEVGTRLLLAYLYSRYNELVDVDPHEEYPTYDARANGPRLLALLDRFAAMPSIPAPDRLAAISYRARRFDTAARFAAQAQTPLAAWVRAKLALHDGKLDIAAQEYATAAQSFPADESWGEVPFPSEYYEREDLKPRCRVQAEAGTLALSRGDYLQALELLYAAADTYWADAAYIAERVVSVDELKTFVDRVAPKAVAADARDAGGVDEEGVWHEAPPANQLRALLARRLMREQRFDVAAAYFDDATARGQAERYIAARNATQAWTRVSQARAWFEAATLARQHGLEILGFEGDPDYAIWSGDYDLNSPITWDEDYNPVYHDRSDLKIEGPYTSDGERQRVAASRAQPLERFHYRLTAAGLAGKAADLLPPRSQAFAAVLCEATHWLIDRQPEQARDIYRRYLREGPYVPWGASFGRQCPAPDFDKVEREIRAAWLKRIGRWAAIGVPLLVLLGAGAWWLRRRGANRAKLAS